MPVTSKEINVFVRNSENVLYEGLAKAVTSLNDKGTFDVLPTHANFISLIKKFVRIYQKDGQIKEIPVDSGVIRVLENAIEIYLGV